MRSEDLQGLQKRTEFNFSTSSSFISFISFNSVLKFKVKNQKSNFNIKISNKKKSTMGGNTSCHELKSKCDAGDEESCKNLHANCQCFLANNKNVVEEVHSTGFHLLELHNNSAGIGILYFLAFGGLIV